MKRILLFKPIMGTVPYKGSGMSKKDQVEEMFDDISSRYDLLNHLFSFNIDKVWRRKAIRLLGRCEPLTILDIATGTADFALAAVRLNPQKITGIDLSEGMLKKGRRKIERKGLADLIELLKADSEALPFRDNSFDASIVGFGVRNFENTGKALEEIYRVLKPGGVFIVLEFSQPRNAAFKFLYSLYFNRVLPWLGGVFSKNRRAYSYLPASANVFPDGECFMSILKNAGFETRSWMPLTFGIASIYEVQKPEI